MTFQRAFWFLSNRVTTRMWDAPQACSAIPMHQMVIHWVGSKGHHGGVSLLILSFFDNNVYCIN